jgi:hypothetical protein
MIAFMWTALYWVILSAYIILAVRVSVLVIKQIYYFCCGVYIFVLVIVLLFHYSKNWKADAVPTVKRDKRQWTESIKGIVPPFDN